MSEKPKGPETTPDIPQRNGVELPHIQEARQLKIAAQRVREVTRRHNNAQGDMQDRREASDEFSAASMIDLGPGPDLPLEENFVESAEVKDAREKERNIARKGYQEQLKKTYEAHLTQVKDAPLEQQKLGKTYLEGCIKDLQISTENPSEEDVTMLAETLPDAWRKTLLDQEFAKKNPQLQKIRDSVLDRIADGAASIDREDFPNDQEYQRALLENFVDISGVSIDSKRELQTLLETLKKQKEQGKSTPEVERVMGVLQNTLGEQGDGNIRGFDDLGGPVSDIGVCSENFPNTPEALQSALSSIRADEGASESKNPQRIREYHAAAGLNAGPQTPWCMSFVQYMSRKYLGYNGPKTASARDGLKMGNIISTPEVGAIVVTRGAGPSGCHIGISVGNGEYISGNSGNAVKIKKIPSGAQFRSLQKGFV